MSTLKAILKWFFGISFVLSGVFSITDSPIVAILSIILGFFLIPSTLKIIEQKIKYIFPTPIKWVIAVGGFFLVVFAISSKIAAEDRKVDRIVDEASILIDKGEFESAKAKIDEAKGKYSTTVNKATRLENEIEKSKSLDFAKEQLVELSDEEFSKLQEGTLEKIILTQKTLNKKLIGLMKKQAPERERIIKEIQQKKEQERIEAELEAERKKQEELNKNRKKTIEKQFSAWNGSHRNLTKVIKKSMNDPDSYEHVETKYWDMGDHLVVLTTFRGKNAFGGKVKNSVKAKIALNGQVLEIMEQF